MRLRQPGEKVRQGELEGVFAVTVSSTLQPLDNYRLFLGSGGGESDRGAANRSAEEVIGLDRAGNRLAGEVIRLPGCQVYFEFGKHVAFDLDRAFGGGGTRGGADFVTAKVQVGGEHEINRRNPELRGRAGFLEHLVPLRIFDRKGDRFAGQGLLGSTVQGQTAQVDGLARLIKWFIGREQHSGRMLQLNFFDHAIPAEGGLGLESHTS